MAPSLLASAVISAKIVGDSRPSVPSKPAKAAVLCQAPSMWGRLLRGDGCGMDVVPLILVRAGKEEFWWADQSISRSKKSRGSTHRIVLITTGKTDLSMEMTGNSRREVSWNDRRLYLYEHNFPGVVRPFREVVAQRCTTRLCCPGHFSDGFSSIYRALANVVDNVRTCLTKRLYICTINNGG